MPDYDNNLRGVLFPNEKQSDTHPDYKGNVEVDGTEYWMSGWKKVSKAGKPFLSISLTAKEPKTDTVAKVDDSPISLSDVPF